MAYLNIKVAQQVWTENPSPWYPTCLKDTHRRVLKKGQYSQCFHQLAAICCQAVPEPDVLSVYLAIVHGYIFHKHVRSCRELV